jgi:hypothetical protein
MPVKPSLVVLFFGQADKPGEKKKLQNIVEVNAACAILSLNTKAFPKARSPRS